MKTAPVFSLFVVFLAGVLISIFFLRAPSRTYIEERKVTIYQINSQPDSVIRNLGDSRIFFGHQSVGMDIVNGMRLVAGESPLVQVKFVETRDISDLPLGTLAHWKIGRNTRPDSKIRAFKKIMLESSVGAVDIALMKFCYVDISHGTDVESLIGQYCRAISELQSSRPDTVFVHLTVPIESMPTSLTGMARYWGKTVLRRTTVIEDNAARQHYNQLLRSRFEGQEPVFDLALYESLDRNGRVTFARSNRGAIQFMDRRKTTDGGHLNEVGKRFLGEQLLVFLAERLSERH